MFLCEAADNSFLYRSDLILDYLTTLPFLLVVVTVSGYCHTIVTVAVFENKVLICFCFE